MNLTLEGDGKNDDRGNSSSDVGMIEVVCGRYSLVGDMVAVGAGRAGWNGAVSVRVEECASLVGAVQVEVSGRSGGCSAAWRR